MIDYQDLDTATSFKKLRALASRGSAFPYESVLTGDRIRSCRALSAAGLVFSWAAKPVDDAVLDVLQTLAEEQQLVAKYKALLDGELINTGEKRRVLHHLTRGRLGGPVKQGGRDLEEFYNGERNRFSNFAERIHREQAFTTVVQIGIGGSDLGPRAVYLALEQWAKKAGRRKMKAEFISNVDPDDASAVLAKVDLPRTLFVLVSKSGITQETLANELFVKAKLHAAGLDPAKRMVAVTSETSPLAHNADYLESFYIDDYIGGRYSSTSAVGGVVLSLAFGPETFAELLSGAHEADVAALEPDARKNASLLDALLGIWERNALGYPCTAVLPYSQALSRFPAHLQQLDMESNGKRVNRFGKPVSYSTGPVVFGEPGTNGQHSFFQLLHQGTDVVPLQFIAFAESQRGEDVEVEGSTSQVKLLANLTAQIVAFAVGKADPDGNKNFPGGRPSSLIFGKSLNPAAVGALLAHFENKVMFQGFAWNLNSFDQEGVQLGKVLTKKVLSRTSEDSALEAYAELMGLRGAL